MQFHDYYLRLHFEQQFGKPFYSMTHYVIWLFSAEAPLDGMLSILVLRKSFYGYKIFPRLLTQNCFPLMHDHM